MKTYIVTFSDFSKSEINAVNKIKARNNAKIMCGFYGFKIMSIELKK